MKSEIKILFFIDSLSAGGKERRVLELMSYLNKKLEYKLMVVLTSKEIHYKNFYELGIPYHIIEHRSNRGFVYFIEFYRICLKFKPDIIHAWRNMHAFYSLPSSVLQNIPLVNNQIASGIVNEKYPHKIVDKINFFWSKRIIANSYAGLKAYRTQKSKSSVIHNGVDLNRFNKIVDAQEVKQKYGILTKYVVVMIASYSRKKNHKLFVDVAKKVIAKSEDITFVSAGAIENNNSTYENVKLLSDSIEKIVLLPKISEVEELVSACDIGILLTYSEGISNSIMEYMALGKPVITTDVIGGSKELVTDGVNGYILKSNVSDISNAILNLIEDKNLRRSLGRNGKKTIEDHFSIEKMGVEFEKVYRDVLYE